MGKKAISRDSDGAYDSVAYEFKLVGENAPIYPTLTETKEALDPILTPTSSPEAPMEEGEGGPFIDRRGYTPTDTSENPCIISITEASFGRTLFLSLKTKGNYHHWFYKVEESAPVMVLGTETVSFKLNSGEYKIKIWLTDHLHKKYSDPCTEKEIEVVVDISPTKTHIIQDCTTGKLLKVLHRREVTANSYLRILNGDYEGCWIFTNLKEEQVEVENEDLHDISNITVAQSSIVHTSQDACVCCVLETCPEIYINPLVLENEVPPRIVETVTETSFPSINIRCSAELIIKEQDSEELAVYGDKNDDSKNAELTVLGCPTLLTRPIYYVWIRRSDNCTEEWMNDGKPYEFQYVTNEECGCTSHLMPKFGQLEDNLAEDPGQDDEFLPSLKLKPDGSAVYIVHMLISEDKDAANAGLKSVGFYNRYLDESNTEVTSSIIANNNTDSTIIPTNLYLSPSENHASYFNALHVLDIGKSVSHINKIFFSEEIPF